MMLYMTNVADVLIQVCNDHPWSPANPYTLVVKVGKGNRFFSTSSAAVHKVASTISNSPQKAPMHGQPSSARKDKQYAAPTRSHKAAKDLLSRAPVWITAIRKQYGGPRRFRCDKHGTHRHNNL